MITCLVEKDHDGALHFFFFAVCVCNRAHAIAFSLGPDPFPDGSGFDVNARAAEIICITSTECNHDVYVVGLHFLDGFSVTNGFVERLSAEVSGTFFNPFTNARTATALIGLAPGTTFDVTIGGGFDPLTSPIGTFPETLDAASFEGTDSNGNTIMTSLLSSPSTTGTVLITPTEGGYIIDNTITVNTTSFINGQPRTIAPVTATNTPPPAAAALPEPTGLALLMAPVAGLAAMRRRG